MNMYTSFRSDRRVHPQIVSVHYLTYDEVLTLRVGQHAYVSDDNGRLAQVKITSIRTWKRKADVKIGWKYGLYEFGSETVTPEGKQLFFVSDPMAV